MLTNNAAFLLPLSTLSFLSFQSRLLLFLFLTLYTYLHSLLSIHHILVGCKTALYGKRYTWRHDSVLTVFERYFREFLQQGRLQGAQDKQLPHISKSFVRQGQSSIKPSKPQSRRSLLSGALDWKLLVDYDRYKIVFPPEIYGTSERPDIVIWSRSLRKVILIELTVPAEEGFEAAEARKLARYKSLTESIIDAKWKPTLMTVEVGARGCPFFCPPLL